MGTRVCVDKRLRELETYKSRTKDGNPLVTDSRLRGVQKEKLKSSSSGFGEDCNEISLYRRNLLDGSFFFF